MIRTAQAMIAAMRRDTWRGVVLYEGPSQLDGAPVVAILTCIVTASVNSKTGAMVQSYVLRSDVDPLTALRLRLNSSICGDCIHRPDEDGHRTCYVNIGRGAQGVFDAYQRGRYARPGVDYDPAILPALFAALLFRAGTYGDPTAIPFQPWRAATLRAQAITGYTHQWRNPRFAAFKAICMASVDTVEEADEAEAAGWRTFRVRKPGEILRNREKPCPASAEMGHKTTCDKCQACGGWSAKAKVSMVINAHGIGAGFFNRRVAA